MAVASDCRTGTPFQPSSVVGPTKLIELDAERPRHRHADAEHASARAKGCKFRDHRLDLAEGGVGIDPRKIAPRPADDLAGEVDQAGLEAERRDMDADGEAAFGVDGERRRRVAAALRLGAAGDDETLVLDLADDIGDGLGGEADATGDVGAGDGGVETDRLQHDAPVIGPAEFLVGAAERHPHP